MNSKMSKQERNQVADTIMSHVRNTKRLQRTRLFFDKRNTFASLKALYAEALEIFKGDHRQEIEMAVAENRYEDIDTLLQGFEDSIWNS